MNKNEHYYCRLWLWSEYLCVWCLLLMGRGFKEALEMKLKCIPLLFATASAYVGVGGLWWGCYCTTVYLYTYRYTNSWSSSQRNGGYYCFNVCYCCSLVCGLGVGVDVGVSRLGAWLRVSVIRLYIPVTI